MNEHMELCEYIAAYIQEELSRGKTIADIDKWMIADAIEAFEGGAADYVRCPKCHEMQHIGGLIGETTDDCPRCGSRILGAQA